MNKTISEKVIIDCIYYLWLLQVGEMPTEMFFHFFKSLSDAAGMNLHIRATGDNEHHKIEGIFKALAHSINMAVRRDIYKYDLPSSKGVL